MWKRFLSSYFSFTKKERTGIIVLLVLIIIFLLLPFLYPFFIKQKTYDYSQFKNQIDSLQENKQDSNSYKKYYSKNDDESNSYADDYKNHYSKKYNDEPQGETFDFDPNTLDEAGWKRLGVKDKTIQTIQKYLSKGGKFRKPEDIGKVWGLSPETVERLMPHVKIAETTPTYKNEPYPTTYEKKEYKKEIVPIDVNTADST